MIVRALGANGQPERLTFEFKPHDSFCPHVYPGNVCLTDRFGKVVEFFTFGGEIRIAEKIDETIFSLCSTAPIFMYLSNKGSLADQFVAEVEAEFNALRALSGSQDGEFERDLAALDAKTLYEVTIRDLWKKYLVSHTMQKAFPDCTECWSMKQIG